jgi:hypothetical protein
VTRVIYSESTYKRMIALERACVYLLDYKPPGHEISRQERLALCDLLPSGMTPEDAAESVQAMQLSEEPNAA